MKKKILYVVAHAQYFISHRLSLANAAQNYGYLVGVATTSLTQDLSKITSYDIPFKRGSLNIFYELKTVWHLYKAIRHYQPHIVHNVALKPSLYGTFLARLLGLSTVNAINGFGYIFTSLHLKARLLRPFITFFLKGFLNHPSVTVIVQNQEDYQDCKSLLEKASVLLIPGSGVDPEIYKPIVKKKNPPFTFTLVARMLWSKGIQEYVTAALHLKKQYPKAHFLLVGNPDPENPESIPKEILNEWNAAGHVEWLGYQENIKALYDKTHVAVLPSYREGMPKSLLEAMACGLPIITTESRGCYDLVKNNGFLVPVKNIKALETTMKKFLTQPELCKKMGEVSRNLIEKNYTTTIVNEKILNIYQTISNKTCKNK